MNKSGALIKTTGRKTAQLFTKLHDRNQLVFDLGTAAELMETDKQHAAGILHAAARRGLVTHLQRGLYNLVPFEMGSVNSHFQGRYEIVGASLGTKPYFFSHASAFDLHRLTTQPVYEVYVSTPHRLAKRNLAGSLVHFVNIPHDRFFGSTTHKLGDQLTVVVSDIERSLLDGLALPRYCNGLTDVAKAFSMAGSRLNLTKLIAYSHQLQRASVIRRLGFVLETLRLAPSETLEELRATLPAGLAVLDPELPKEGAGWSARWGLRLNVSAEEIVAAVSH
jgi:predicted transcriptional regulator of viral defense system